MPIRKAMRATSVDEVIVTDFENYAPAYGVPDAVGPHPDR